MEIRKATFDCTIAMPGYANVKPGASEIVLAPGEQIEDAWTELKRRAMAWHRKEYPHLYDDPVIFEKMPNEKVKKEEEPDGRVFEFDASLSKEISELQAIQFKEDAQEWLNKETWRKYNPVLKSLVNSKPNKS